MYLAWSIIGPAIAFIGGGFMLSVFVDFQTVSKEEIGISTSDARWIGAWWLPYIIAGVLNFLAALPMAAYPHDLPGAAELRRQKVSEAQVSGKEGAAGAPEGAPDQGQGTSMSDFKARFISVFTNATWICLTVLAFCDNFIIAGYTAFGPKLIEVLFSVSATMAGTLFGVVLLPAGAGGTIIGGLLVEKLKLSCRQIIQIQAVLSAFVTVTSALFLLTCDPILFAGVSAPYNASVDAQSPFNLTDSCNVGCGCEHAVYEPICSVLDNVQYYSPCHAGCVTLLNKSLSGGNKEEYLHCSCIAPLGGPGRGEEAVAVWGSCSGDICPFAILFLSAFFLAVLAIFVCMTMNMTATLRCVTRSQAALAISAQVLFNRLLGTIPGPVVVGLAFDLACDLWTDDCGVKGACLSYDIGQLARSQFYTCIVIKCVSLVAALVAVCVYKPPRAAGTVSPTNSEALVGRSAEQGGPLDSFRIKDKLADISYAKHGPVNTAQSGQRGVDKELTQLSSRYLSTEKLLTDSDFKMDGNGTESSHL